MSSWNRIAWQVQSFLRLHDAVTDALAALTESVHMRHIGNFESLVRSKRADILRIAAANGATRVRVFGSVARGTTTAESDLDLLIDLEAGRDLLDVVAIKQDLEDLLGRDVHVVTEDALSPYIRHEVLRDAAPL